ncbi:hypothetical protein ALI22I_40685 [Saccharothrix sp. ALI-22-I]|nr:hypothetical protein ALI22I_40685 [Saccharothrix sp. ALI-22-I]
MIETGRRTISDVATRRHIARVLGQGRAALGVSLGTVLPEERLAAAARWTGKALVVAERLGDSAFLAHALRMYGNELRKADHVGAAVAHLSRAVTLSNDHEGQGAAFALLAYGRHQRGSGPAVMHDRSTAPAGQCLMSMISFLPSGVTVYDLLRARPTANSMVPPWPMSFTTAPLTLEWL